MSGGSFTALADGLYGDKLFADYEQRFLKRDVQGELISRSLNPAYWPDYIGGTADSASHWRLMSRLMTEIKRWTADPEAVPTQQEDILKDFPIWLTKARAWAEHEGVRCILVLDALNQLDEQDHARLLSWLPGQPFSGPLRLIVSTLPGKAGTDDPLTVLQKRRWQELRVPPLSVEERRRMITGYLARFGKQLDAHRLDRLASAHAAANPLYLKILLDDLRVTGTHDRLDHRLTEYLTAADIASLLQQVLARYQRDYERDRPGLVSEALGLIWAARRGLTESELLHLLRPKSDTGHPQNVTSQLPPALWTPLRAALEDSLIDRGGILNFAHDFLRTAVETAFVPDQDKRDDYQLQLADDFEAQPITARTCDELPWLLRETESLVRLRACLLNIDRFLLLYERDMEEPRSYWVKPLGEQQTMGKAYLESFESWWHVAGHHDLHIAYAASQLATFLLAAALHTEAEPLMRIALTMDEQSCGESHPDVAIRLNNLAVLMKTTSRFGEAEPLMRRALTINEASFGKDHPAVATSLNNLATVLQDTNRLTEAEQLMRRALAIDEARLGKDHPKVAIDVNNLAGLLRATNRFVEAESLMRRVLTINEASFGKDHPTVATSLSWLAGLLKSTSRFKEAEPLIRRALAIDEASFGKEHPNVAIRLNNLAELLQDTNRPEEAEALFRRALAIHENSFGKDHPNSAPSLNNLASLLQATNRLAEAEPLIRRALAIDEASFGKEHPNVAAQLNSLALLLKASSRLGEAEPLMRRGLAILESSLGINHPYVATQLSNLAELLQDGNRLAEAEPLIRRALAINEASLGKDHPNIATNLNNLAKLLHAMKRFGEAEPLMRRALAFDEARFGNYHPDVARDLNNIAALLQSTNRLGEAEPLMRRALAIWEASLGKTHPDVGISLWGLSNLLRVTNRHKEAEPLMRRMVNIFLSFTRDTGHPHPHLMDGLNNYIELQIEMGDTQMLALNKIRAIMEPYGMSI